MLRPLFILFIAAFFSCDWKKNNPQGQNEGSNVLPVDTVIIKDSMSFNTYSIDVDSSYFHTTPDPNTKTEKFLNRGIVINVYRINGDFAYSTPIESRDIFTVKGWLKMKDLERIFFTPPKITK